MPFDFDQWTKTIDTCMRKVSVPGATAILASSEGILRTHSYGYKNHQSKASPTAKTLFPIASLSKNFAGTVLLMMVQDAHLNLDDPIQKHLPDVQIGTKDLWGKLTCADLLTHNSGFDESILLERYALFQKGPKAVIEALKDYPQSFPYKTTYSYFNLTYTVIIPLIEKFYQLDWKTFLQTRLFDPLDFQHTTVDQETMLSRDHSNLYAFDAHGQVYEDNFYNIPDQLTLAGGLYSSAGGLGKWIKCHLQQGAPLLDEDCFKKMYHPYTAINPIPDYDQVRYATERYHLHHYGLGLKIGSVNGHALYYHEGAIKNARSILVIIPSQNRGAAILTNIGDHDAASVAMFYLMDEMLGLPEVDHIQYLCPVTRQLRQNLMDPLKERAA